MSEILILEGTVVHGQALGRRFGFPTANLSLPDGQSLPEAGVYASVAVLEDGARCPAVTNVGARPTVDDSGRSIRAAPSGGASSEAARHPSLREHGCAEGADRPRPGSGAGAAGKCQIGRMSAI